MTHISARALIGPNLYTSGPAAVAEVEPGEPHPDLAAAILREHAALYEALGWEPVQLLQRPYTCTDGSPGLALAAPSPVDRIEAGAVLLERAIRRALGIHRRSPKEDLQAIRDEHDEERQTPELRVLTQAAAERGIPNLIDDDAFTLGQGVRARTWSIDQLPAPSAIPWEELGTVPTALITGTNGKSTVTALTGEILAAGGLDPFTGGNLGVPLSAAVLALLRGERPPPGSLVLECSSFQLETMNGAQLHRTDVAMVLNISADHLDRYPDIHAYAATKARIFAGLDQRGLALLDATDPFTPRLRPQTSARLALVEGQDSADPRIVEAASGETLHLAEDEQLPRSALALAGRHTSKNALFALKAARHLGVSLSACEAGLRTFAGLPHRMILVRELDGVRYYDDSKATNVASVVANIHGFDSPYVLIAGGRRKDDDLALLRPHLAEGARALVAIGESAEAFAAIAEGIVPWTIAESMDEAVAKACGYAKAGDAVLLSPACSSFDWFRNYAERGEMFIRAVEGLPHAHPGT